MLILLILKSFISDILADDKWSNVKPFSEFEIEIYWGESAVTQA